MRIYHWILLRTGNFPNRVREDQNTHFRFIKFCPGMVLFVRWSGKTYDRVRCATVDNIVPWNALCMLYKYGRRQPLIIFYTDCFPWQKWLSERASVLLYMYLCTLAILLKIDPTSQDHTGLLYALLTVFQYHPCEHIQRHSIHYRH